MEYRLRLKSVKIRGQGMGKLVAHPKADFYPMRLEVPSGIAPDFKIVDVCIGKRGQLGVVEMTALLFTDQSCNVRWADDGLLISPAGTDIIVTAKNISNSQKVFRCEVIGLRAGAPEPKRSIGRSIH